MSQAQQQLGQNQNQQAQGSMSKAAQALQQAAQQLAKQQQSSQQNPNSPSSELGTSAKGLPDLSLLSKDAQKKYAGKSWGELPGELKTELLMKAQEKYGEDYARIIKLYFEQLADKK